ncbi:MULTISPECIES: multidrug effflux MFS transporter [unclassified Francisella]|uniref:multidrug effflux MFS transporter n=1 Tax=unclassified Francisella TaxID=2610885 RepID=UPI002E2F52DE|nr:MULTISPECIES: multidrug effflux MFS transporter [unclassified Francisella]MED7819687.1 multidrug effflux MFS transporter [Francisella sp. 19S2-4]MED7830491.1 multidrug effflux MFS transporter [Francisella sp. 19S2-10]
MWKHSPLKTVLILAPIIFCCELAMESYIPVLPIMGKSLHTTQSMAQLTVSVFLIISGVGQLILGPLSDQMGRYKVIFMSAILFLFGTLFCALSPGVKFLIFSRAIQAVGACGLSVVAFVIIRDSFSGKQSSMVYNLVDAIVSLSPILGPPIGVTFALLFNWQSIFVFLFILSIVMLLIIIFFVKESLPVERRKKFSLDIIYRYWTVSKSLQFWAYSISAVSGMSAFLIFFTMIPYIIIYLSDPYTKIYIMFGFTGIAYLIGAVFASFIVNHLGVFKTTIVGVVCVFIAGILSLASYVGFGLSLWMFFAPCFFAAFGCAIAAGTGASGSMEPFFEIAGVASAMFGTMELSLSAIVVGIAMSFPATSALPIALTMLITSAFALFLLIILKIKKKNLD